jgi:hypothetical protein
MANKQDIQEETKQSESTSVLLTDNQKPKQQQRSPFTPDEEETKSDGMAGRPGEVRLLEEDI